MFSTKIRSLLDKHSKLVICAIAFLSLAAGALPSGYQLAINTWLDFSGGLGKTVIYSPDGVSLVISPDSGFSQNVSISGTESVSGNTTIGGNASVGLTLTIDAGCILSENAAGQLVSSCQLSNPGGLNITGVLTFDGGCSLSENASGQLSSSCQIAGVNGGSGGLPGWQTALDCDFTQQPLQLLPTGDGGTFTACGTLWTVTAANSASGSAIDGGLILKCTSTGGIGLPYEAHSVYASLGSLIPNFNGNMPLRISIYFVSPTNNATSGNYEEFALDNEPQTGTSIAENAAMVYRQFDRWVFQNATNGASLATDTITDATLGTAYSVGQMYFGNGINLSMHSLNVSTYDGGLPPLGGDRMLAWHTISGNADSTNNFTQGSPSLWNVYLSCVETTGTMITNFGRIKIEYKN